MTTARRDKRALLKPLTLVGVLAALLLFLVTGQAQPAYAATFTVDSTGDGGDSNTADGVCDDGTGACTLRAAIEQANVLGPDTIAFNIPAATDAGCNAVTGVCTIQPASALPTIIDPVVIDGYTQPVASPNTNPTGSGSNAVLKIELDGTNVGAGTNAGLFIGAGNSTVRGLVINRFPRHGIFLAVNGSNRVEGNYIGTDVTGALPLGNGFNGVTIANSNNNIIGGTTAAALNVISGNNIGGVVIGIGATGNQVQGNFIGTQANGTGPLGNTSHGVVIQDAFSNTIGGAGAQNVISANGGHGVLIAGSGATGNTVQGNLVGTDVTGTANLGNTLDGVRIRDGASSNTIGGTTAGAGNTIAFNGLIGVGVVGARTTGNTIRGNSIHSNVSRGIDNFLGGNTELAPPTVTAAASASGTTCANCTVDVYSDSADEGRIYHGSTMADLVAAEGDPANWSFLGAVTGPNITATATDASGNTSEFSAPFAFVADSDIDGVPDASDLCPGTSTRATVDANGCSDAQVDDDGDGICDPGAPSAGPSNCTGVDACPGEDAFGFDANSDGCIDTPEGLVQIIQTLPAETLSAELQNSLVSKVENAQKSGDKDNICAGVNQLEAFINQINAQRGKKVSDEAADDLIAFAQSAIAALNSQLPAGETCK